MKVSRPHRLFGKSLIKVQGVSLENADLSAAAAAVATALHVEPSQVWVVFAGEQELHLDVMSGDVELAEWLGAEASLLESLARVPGVEIGDSSHVSGEGILGSVAWDGCLDGLASNSQAAYERFELARTRRATVWATGNEVVGGRIVDRNSPFLANLLRDAGLRAELGGILRDDPVAIAAGLESSLSRGSGWIVTTGGLGHGPGDFTLQGIARLDPSFAHQPAVSFEHDGRHAWIEIGVGEVEGALLIALPGPHDEVRACAATLRTIVEQPRLDKHNVARLLAEAVAGLYVSRRDRALPGRVSADPGESMRAEQGTDEARLTPKDESCQRI